jgi:SsrA-binding protein
MEIINRKARHEYDVLETYIAGISLFGSEVKSIKAGKANIGDAYCYVSVENEIWMKNSHVSKYDSDKFTNHEEKRERKLLLKKKEIRKIKQDVQNPGITIIPLKMYINKGLIKILIGICKGKKNYDKRNDIKDKDNKRDLERVMKNF